MPTVNMICPRCKVAVRKTLIFDNTGKASRSSGICNKCRGPITWWGEGNRARIAKKLIMVIELIVLIWLYERSDFFGLFVGAEKNSFKKLKSGFLIELEKWFNDTVLSLTAEDNREKIFVYYYEGQKWFTNDSEIFYNDYMNGEDIEYIVEKICLWDEVPVVIIDKNKYWH